MKRITQKIALAFSLLVPALAFAQTPTNFVSFAELILNILRGVTTILFAATVLGLLYGVVMYFVHADNPAKREEIKPYLLWAVIGVAVMFGVWGFVQLLYSSFFGAGVVGLPFISPPTRSLYEKTFCSISNIYISSGSYVCAGRKEHLYLDAIHHVPDSAIAVVALGSRSDLVCLRFGEIHQERRRHKCTRRREVLHDLGVDLFFCLGNSLGNGESYPIWKPRTLATYPTRFCE